MRIGGAVAVLAALAITVPAPVGAAGIGATSRDRSSRSNDDIKGGAGEDYLIDDLGYDVIYGGSHDDQIFTGSDADFLDGGDGNDVLGCGWFGDDYDTAYGGLGYGDTFDDCEDASG